MRRATLSDAACDAAQFGIVGTVSIQAFGMARQPPGLAGDGPNGPHQADQLLHVVPVGPAQAAGCRIPR